MNMLFKIAVSSGRWEQRQFLDSILFPAGGV